MRALRWLWFGILGLFALLGLMVALSFVGFALIWRDFTVPPEPVPAGAILQLDFRTAIVEADPIRFPFVGALETQLTLRELIEALHAAAEDERVVGVIARVNGARLGLAQIEEIREAVAAFRQSGKPALAFAETFGEGGNGTLDYYLASAFDEIWVQPSAELGITGLRIEMPFLRSLLIDLGIQPEFAAREDYKSAADMFLRDEMSPAQRRNLEALMRSWMAQLVGDIAVARGLDVANVEDLIDRAPLSADAAMHAGLVDGLAYRDAIERTIRDRAEDSALYAFEDYAVQLEPDDGAAKIALVYGVGPIHLGKGTGDGFGASDMGADTVVAALRQARETEDVVAVVLRLDSPGGSYVASDAIWREVERTRETGLPIVVSMGNVAASGGYFVAAAASAIVADRGTITGSIGVVSGKFALDGLWADIGVRWDGVGFGANSDMQSPHRPFTEAQWLKLEETLDRIYDDFLQRVATGRGLDRDAVRAVAQGQIWSGSDALAHGLVDEIGGLHRAVAVALEQAGYAPESPYELVPVRGEDVGLDGMLGDLEATLRSLREFARTVSKISAFIEAGGALVDGPALLADPALAEPH
jgi:protease-4